MNDNVRKIFDMLGVEPNEEFNVRGFLGKYFIDESLWLKNKNKESCSYLFVLILNDPSKIIKLPKKKKLRDLTMEEYDKWNKKIVVRFIIVVNAHLKILFVK